jgi:tetratricopeptide (TPR) repeat protein
MGEAQFPPLPGSSPNLRVDGHVPSTLPILGRDAELAQLEAVFQRAVDYQAPQLVTVLGPQGVGKTRLVAEWLQRLLSRHPAGTPGRPRVYRGKAAAGAGSYSLVSRLLRDRFGILDADSTDKRLERVRAQLTDVFADRRMAEVIHFLGRFLDLRITGNAFIRAVTSQGPDSSTRHEDAIARTVLRRFLELDAERSPLVLAFDNLHAADDDSLTLLAELAEGLGGSPVVLIAAARPDLFVRRPTWGQGSMDDGEAAGAGQTGETVGSPIDHTRIELAPLGRSDSEKLLRSLLVKAEPLPPLLVQDACELTAGNPFFIEELVRVFRSNGTITSSTANGKEKWRIDPQKAARVELPMSVEEAIQARISALSIAERELLERGAALGSVFWLGALVVLGRIDKTLEREVQKQFQLEERARIEALLEEMVERDYLLRMPDSTVPGDNEFAFKHNLEHDLVTKLIPPERARRYHRVAAEWLETKLPPLAEQSAEQLDFQASLYELGGYKLRAAAAYLAAADKARARFANDSAATLYEKGLALYEKDDAIGRIHALHNHGDVLHRAGRTKEALEAFQEMLSCAWRLDHHAKAGAAHGRIARVHRSHGEYSLAETHLQKALELFRQAGDTRGLAAVEDDIGRVAFLRGDYAMAIDRHSRSLDLRRALGDQRSIALSLHNLALVHQASGAHGEAVVRFSEALALRREVGDKPGVVQSLVAMAAAWRERGDVQRSFEVLNEALQLAREIGDRLEQATILVRMGEALLSLGREAEASDQLAQASELAQSFGDKLVQSEAARLLAEVFMKLDDLRAARTEARRALELAEKVGSRPYKAMAHRVLGTIIAKGGITDDDRAEADSHFQQAIEILGGVGAELELGHTYRSYSWALQLRGDFDAAATFAERADEITQHLGPQVPPRPRPPQG